MKSDLPSSPLRNFDLQYDDAASAIRVEWVGPGYHTRVPDGEIAHPVIPSLEYAILCLEEGSDERLERARRILSAIPRLQDRNPVSPAYGVWPWLMEEPLDQMATVDRNWADFCGVRLAQILHDHGKRLGEGVAAGCREALGHAAWSVFRRNIQPDYTNIAVMGGGAAACAGELLDQPRLLEYGRARLAAVVDYTRHHGGFQEYNSPTYTTVLLYECDRFLRILRDPETRRSAEWLREKAWETLAEHFHPPTSQWAGPHSRCYTEWLDEKTCRFLADQTGADIRPYRPSDRPWYEPGTAGIRHSPCPEKWRDRFIRPPESPGMIERVFHRDARGEPDCVGRTWLGTRACLGSVSAGSAWSQRRPILGYWNTASGDVARLRIRFLRDGKDFASAGLYTVQRDARLLTTVGVLLDYGDRHLHLDRPGDNVFRASDFRLRCELEAPGAAARDHGDGRFELAAEPVRAWLAAAPGVFDGRPVAWTAGGEDIVAVEAICYRGPERAFDFAALGRTCLAFGLVLDGEGAEAAPDPGDIRQRGPADREAVWEVPDPLRVERPADPRPRGFWV